MNIEINKNIEIICKPINLKLFRKIPFDIIINHILPFTEKHQSKKHLENIRSFVMDYNIIYNFYIDEYHHASMVYNMLQFITNVKLIAYNSTIYKLLIKITNNNKFINEDKNIKHSRILCGLLSPLERTKFINDYIILLDE